MRGKVVKTIRHIYRCKCCNKGSSGNSRVRKTITSSRGAKPELLPNGGSTAPSTSMVLNRGAMPPSTSDGDKIPSIDMGLNRAVELNTTSAFVNYATEAALNCRSVEVSESHQAAVFLIALVAVALASPAELPAQETLEVAESANPGHGGGGYNQGYGGHYGGGGHHHGGGGHHHGGGHYGGGYGRR
uniref:Uncharacterized protein n=1 Tax=Timema douglasi TaxID=61478 RepID=A0A7R8ZDJ9_TIMDO|nr:unnamed protein product [Timema douglasi]